MKLEKQLEKNNMNLVKLYKINPNKSFLRDYNWLYELYVDRGLSTTKIAKMLGCNHKTVSYWLKKHNIRTREKINEKAKNTLKDPAKLRMLYEEKRMSLKSIAKELGCNDTTVMYWMKKHGIIIRNLVQAAANRCQRDTPLTSQLFEYINGSMLGDGYLRFYVNVANYTLVSKYSEYCDHIAEIFEKAKYRVHSYSGVNISCNCKYFSITACSSIQLAEIYKRWYPNGKKTVPEDLELTPMTCLYWYLEDGSLVHHKRISVRGIHLSTQGFSRKENEELVTKLKNVLRSTDIVLARRNYIRLNKKAAVKFLLFIGDESPVRCFDHKFSPALTAPKL